MSKGPEASRTPAELIDSTKYRAGCNTKTSIATRIGLTRQTFAHKCNYPSTFTKGEIQSLAYLLQWSDAEIGEFIKG